MRIYIRASIGDRGHGWALLVFSYRAAVLAEKTEEEEWLRWSLVAHAIEDLAAGDVRDNLTALTLVVVSMSIAPRLPLLQAPQYRLALLEPLQTRNLRAH